MTHGSVEYHGAAECHDILERERSLKPCPVLIFINLFNFLDIIIVMVYNELYIKAILC